MSNELVPGYGKGMDLGKSIGKAIASILAVVAVPVALLTQLVYRKDLGERYASMNRRITAAAVIVAAGALHRFYPIPSLAETARGVPRPGPVLSHPMTTNIAIGVLMLFVLACVEHELRLRNRYKTDGRWHSRSPGVDRLPGFGIKLQILVTLLLAAGAFYLKLDYFGIVLAASGIFAGVIDANAKREFYHRVLDTVDGQIEAEMVGKAVKERLSPAQAEGLQAHLPAYVSGQARERIAEAFDASQKRVGSKPTGAVELKPQQSTVDTPW